jgi:hypothetical protein
MKNLIIRVWKERHFQIDVATNKPTQEMDPEHSTGFVALSSTAMVGLAMGSSTSNMAASEDTARFIKA